MNSKVVITSIIGSALAIGAIILYSNRMPYIVIKTNDVDWDRKKANISFGGKKYSISLADSAKTLSPDFTFSDKYYLYIINKSNKTFLYIVDSKSQSKQEGVIIDWNSKIIYNDVLAS